MMRVIRTLIALVALFPLVAWSQPTNMVVFGDSLSDNGNLATLATGTPTGAAIVSPPYDNGRITNGPVAVEVLNNLLGFAPLEAALASNGTNFAIAGARVRKTGDSADDAISVPSQISTYLASMGGNVSSDTLFVLIAGGNDIRDARDLDDSSGDKIAKDASRKLRNQMRKLIRAGGKYFLVTSVPDIGQIPESLLLADASGSQRPVVRGSALSEKFNDNLWKKTNKLKKQYPDVTIVRYRISKAFNEIVSGSPGNGFRVTDRACYIVVDGAQSWDPECFFGAGLGAFVFFDFIHPTAVVHEAVGEAIFDKLQASIPGVTSSTGGSTGGGTDGGTTGGGTDGGTTGGGTDGGKDEGTAEVSSDGSVAVPSDGSVAAN